MNISKFSLAEASSNNSGKTSGSGTAGLYLVFIGGVVGLIATIGSIVGMGEVPTILLFATGTITTGATLLGYRKSVEKTAIENGGLEEVKPQ